VRSRKPAEDAGALPRRSLLQKIAFRGLLARTS
jgi:hypothetical protein